MASHRSGAVVEPEMHQRFLRPRSKVFSIGGEIYDSSDGLSPKEKAKRRPLPFLPPKEKVFDMFFFWELYDHLAKRCLRQDVPLVALRNLSCKLMVIFDQPDPLDFNFFGDLSKKFCSWKDIRHALLTVGHPQIPLTTTERVFLTLDDDRSCKLAQVWFWFILVVTIANLVRMVQPRFVDTFCTMAGLGDCGDSFQVTCLLVFSIDYGVRFLCAPFVRLELLSPRLHYFDVDDYRRRPLTGWSRLGEFVKKSDNLVDLIAIMPYWVNMLVGQFMPSSSFLRIIRLARLFRIAKSARYLDMLQVLAMTLWKSTSMVAILFVLIQLVSLIAGCLLQEFEEHTGETSFESVLSAWYWIFCRLIGMKDTPYRSGVVQTDGGITILAITLTLKGVLWIVPIARIKQIFQEEYNTVVKGSSLHQKVVSDLLGQLHDSDKDHLVSTTHGSTFARLEVEVEGGRITVSLPLPIHQMQGKSLPPEYKLPGSWIGEDLGEVLVTVAMVWEPNVLMLDNPEALPFGKLDLAVVSVDPPRPIRRVFYEVPVDFFKPQKHTEEWTEKGHANHRFTISWYVEKITFKKKDDDDDEHAGLEYGEFQAKVLHLLNQQSIALQSQRKKLEKQRKMLAAVDVNQAGG